MSLRLESERYRPERTSRVSFSDTPSYRSTGWHSHSFRVNICSFRIPHIRLLALSNLPIKTGTFSPKQTSARPRVEYYVQYCDEYDTVLTSVWIELRAVGRIWDRICRMLCHQTPVLNGTRFLRHVTHNNTRKRYIGLHALTSIPADVR